MRSTNLAVFSAYNVSAALLRALAVFRKRDTGPPPTKRLLIEAGQAGWDEPAPGLLEIEQSAREYLGSESVARLIVPNRRGGYLIRVWKSLREQRPSHYFYDTRTGSQSPFWGAVQAVVVAALLFLFDVVPITILTNLPARRWRRQVSAVTANRGLVLVLIPRSLALEYFPHDRIIGPIFMPFSQARMTEIRQGIPRNIADSEGQSVTFIGSVYEPRSTIIDQIRREFDSSNLSFTSHERSPGFPKIDQETYWEVLRNSAFLFTTADHILKRGADLGCPPHMVYRYTEALIAESCLIAPDIGSGLVPYEHFIPFTDARTLKEDLSELLASPEKIENLRKQGARFIESRVSSQKWWREIDEALGQDRLK